MWLGLQKRNRETCLRSLSCLNKVEVQSRFQKYGLQTVASLVMIVGLMLDLLACWFSNGVLVGVSWSFIFWNFWHPDTWNSSGGPPSTWRWPAGGSVPQAGTLQAIGGVAEETKATWSGLARFGFALFRLACSSFSAKLFESDDASASGPRTSVLTGMLWLTKGEYLRPTWPQSRNLVFQIPGTWTLASTLGESLGRDCKRGQPHPTTPCNRDHLRLIEESDVAARHKKLCVSPKTVLLWDS